ncbi:1-deoxy-D-xylulose-5-phosphate reductoisomerase [Dissulfurimicrobium hydrothermale]|uniref:1-deoxy-D-xylulose-5-phosphate reductoisomerase n=1 Tax=Dissulfurimicrobium hydrothermale TaxID=1750598 RepID=UPI001EDA9AFD|nr:1-deoxy-D-xylulose-5-phosphate reductoisomerase [Dissulfurimicrobium hydrothermale]UKL14382.1 1-deoxy-D-xylulose-5-phosphate reductoisomerase [Dissulfurimicrobium hydrothermale]
MKTISVLGSTGSIGKNVLDVAARSNGQIKVVGLGAGKNIALLAEQIRLFRPRLVTVMTPELAKKLANTPGLPRTQILYGKAGYRALAQMPEVDIVVSAMVGAAGLIPTIAALDAGKDVALANKESLVTAGPLVKAIADKNNCRLLPVDSEHSAIFQCMAGNRKEDIKRLILTASGGPFKDMSQEEMANVTAEDAIKHPTWSMGAKISVDSATLMNKGLEVIEASCLFDIRVDLIDVLIHPQSIVHSMVEYSDGSIVAQMAVPDMRIPIAYALAWPERMKLDIPALDLTKTAPLTFERPSMDKFPCLSMAYRAAKVGGTATTILNGANEVAVEAFLEGRIGFNTIADIVNEVLSSIAPEEINGLDDVLRADALARLKADNLVQCMTSAPPSRSIIT